MFSHIMLGANDLEVSRGFYDAALGALGIKAGSFSHDKYFYRSLGGVFAITKPIDGNEATHANGGTILFGADSEEQVAAWHAAGMANGGSCEGKPEPKPQAPGSYGAYLRDPDGNKLAAFYNLNLG